MSFSIQFDIAALFVLAVIFVHFISQRRIITMQTSLFLSFIIAVFLSTAFDIIGVWTIDHATIVPLKLNYVVNSIYLSMQFLVPALLFAYACVCMEEAGKNMMRGYPFLCIPAVVGVVVCVFFNYSNGWIFYFDEAFHYTHGPYHYLLQLCSAYYTLAALITVIYGYKKIRKTRARALLLLIAISMLTIVIQVLFPYYIVAGFGMSLLVAVMYLSIQNLEEESDALTGLPSRQAFYVRTRRLLKKNPHDDFVLLYWNIKRFKVFNDLQGLRAGDDVLIALANILKGVTRGTGVCGRLEGDHFVACMPERLFEPELLSMQMREWTDALFSDYRVQLCLGVYVIDDRDVPINLMCDRAHMALLTIAKNDTEWYAVYDNALRTSMIEENEIAREMHRALEEKQFKVYLQPIVDLRTGDIISAEALVRWEHPTKGMIPPKQFIPIFENNGFILKLDYYTWGQVCEVLSRWEHLDMACLPISANISRFDLYNPHVAEDIIELAQRFEVRFDRLKFEITESSYLADTETLLHVIGMLQREGFPVLMDDFGSGYSSLSMLKETPFDQLKIDMGFLSGIDEAGQKGTIIISSVIDMAKKLGLFVIAEGVETKEQAQYLRDAGCDAAQGYYFARPMPVDEFEAAYLASADAPSTRR